MAFCGNCGSKIADNEKFCGECGTPLVVNNASSQTPVQNVVPASPKKPISLATKIIIAVVAAFVVLCGVGYFVGQSLTSKDRVVASFIKALESKDTSKIKSYLISPDSNLKIDDAIVKALVDYIEKDPNWVDTLKDSLKEQSKNMKKKSSSDEGEYLFELKKDGSKFLLFNNYKIQVKPIFVNVSVYYKDTEILVNDKSVFKSKEDNESKKIGPLMPGLYEIKSVYKGEYTNLEKTEEMDLIDSSNSSSLFNSLEKDMGVKGKNVVIYSNFKDAKVFINGKDTGLKVEDKDEFGPVSDDSKIQLKMEFPWGTISSDEITAKDSYLEININAVNDEARNQMINAYNSYNQSLISAVTEKNIDKLTNATEKRKSDVKYSIDSMINYNTSYEGKYLKAVVDMDSFDVYQDSDGKINAEFLVKITFSEAYYTQEYGTPELKEQTQTNKIYMVYNDATKSWEIDGTYIENDMSSSNTKEFTFN